MKRLIILIILACLAQLTFAQLPKIINAEYFWDTDPGQGNGTAMTATDGTFNRVVEQAMASNVNAPSTTGVHIFNVRVKSNTGANWGPLFSVIVSVETAAGSVSFRDVKITSAEYFWGTDPGQGNATPMIAFNGNFDDAVEAAITNSSAGNMNVGAHKFGVRVQDVDGNWSATFSSVISVESNVVLTIPLKITQGECFWNTDPGQGNGMPFIAYDGNFDEAIERASKSMLTGSLTTGANVLHSRFKDVNGKWSRKFSVVVNVQSYFYPDATIFGETNFCSSQPTGIVYHVDSVQDYTYQWSITGGSITSSATAPKVKVNWNASGPYNLQVIETNMYGDDTTSISVTITPSNVPVPTASNDGQICAGNNVSLTASTVSNATYSWTGPGFNSTLQNPTIGSAQISATGWYYVNAIENGCESLKDSTYVTVNSYPVAPIISSNGPVCGNDTLQLTSQTIANATYSWSGPNGFSSSQQNPTVNTSAQFGSGVYTATSTVNGCTSQSAGAVNVTVYTVPATPTVTQVGSNLHSNYSTNNQWYLNGNIINGADSNIYIPTQSGNYTVSYTNANGCTVFSSSFNFVYSGINLISVNRNISVYPNPANDILNIYNTGNDQLVSIDLQNSIGQIVKQVYANNKNNLQLELTEIPNGVYFVVIRTEKEMVNNKIIIAH